MSFTFNKNSGRYTDLESGRYVPRDLIFGELNADVQRFRTTADRLSQEFLDKKISHTTYSRKLREALKPILTRSSALGAGGMGNLEGRQLSQLGNGAKSAYSSLKNLSDQIKAGELTAGQIAERARRLGNHAYAGFHRAEQISRAEGGFSMASRQLAGSGNHCNDCIAHQTQGYVPLDEVVPIGTNCVCGGRCRCQIYYRKASPSEIEAFVGASSSLIDRVMGAQRELMAESVYSGFDIE
jgi:hypothetical protein